MMYGKDQSEHVEGKTYFIVADGLFVNAWFGSVIGGCGHVDCADVYSFEEVLEFIIRFHNHYKSVKFMEVKKDD